MKFPFLKSFLTALSISSSFFIFADMDHAESSSDQGEKVITPDASPVIHHGFDVFVSADFIYWTARVDGLEPPIKDTSIRTDAVSTQTNNQGSNSTADYKISPGFKVGIGLDLKHDGWDTYFEYTYLHTSALFNSHNTSNTLNYSPNVIYSGKDSLVGASNSDWHLHFNNMDWELGRNFFISPKLLLRPHMGLKGSWQNQSINTTQTNIQDSLSYRLIIKEKSDNTFDINTVNAFSNGRYSSSTEQYFWGIGPRTGLNTAWQFNKNWSFFADTSISALWGQFTSERTDLASDNIIQTGNLTPSGTNVTVSTAEQRVHTLRPVLELIIGARWDYWFLDNDYRIRIQAGWEDQVWFGQAQYIVSPFGALNLQGLTLQFRLDF